MLECTLSRIEDPIAGKEIAAKLVEINEESKVTIVVASHGAYPYNQVDRTVFTKDGKIVYKKKQDTRTRLSDVDNYVLVL